VAVVQYRQLCQEYKYTPQDEESIHIHNKETVAKTKEISMEQIGIAINALKEDKPNRSYVSLLTTPSDVALVDALESKRRTFPPKRQYPSSLTKIDWKETKSAPQLTWVSSQMDDCADEQKNAIFIFKEYCNRGAPQEINISKRERTELVNYFSRSVLNPEELTTIFDRAFDSIIDLLANDSLRRFRRHSSFNKLPRTSLLIPSKI